MVLPSSPFFGVARTRLYRSRGRFLKFSRTVRNRCPGLAADRAGPGADRRETLLTDLPGLPGLAGLPAVTVEAKMIKQKIVANETSHLQN